MLQQTLPQSQGFNLPNYGYAGTSGGKMAHVRDTQVGGKSSLSKLHLDPKSPMHRSTRHSGSSSSRMYRSPSKAVHSAVGGSPSPVAVNAQPQPYMDPASATFHGGNSSGYLAQTAGLPAMDMKQDMDIKQDLELKQEMYMKPELYMKQELDMKSPAAAPGDRKPMATAPTKPFHLMNSRLYDDF
ncbi:hypothetical protein BJV82DRAFT_606175 [Fennellomyces sp. T-0311]|nr:hypothetical protein BJV82DRAFT_606175 [Fennellomyces sp. T-0311]